MIYETLVRDFDEAQTFQDLINQLDYLEFKGTMRLSSCRSTNSKAT